MPRDVEYSTVLCYFVMGDSVRENLKWEHNLLHAQIFASEFNGVSSGPKDSTTGCG